MDTLVGGAGAVAEAQRRLQLVLRSQHGPQAPAVWAQACSEAGVLCTGDLALDELDRVAGRLLERGGADAVAAGSCRVRLLFLRRTATGPLTRAVTRPAPSAARPAAPQPARTAASRTAPVQRLAGLDDAVVLAALAEPDALDEQAWLARLAALEAEVTSGPS